MFVFHYTEKYEKQCTENTTCVIGAVRVELCAVVEGDAVVGVEGALLPEGVVVEDGGRGVALVVLVPVDEGRDVVEGDTVVL